MRRSPRRCRPSRVSRSATEEVLAARAQELDERFDAIQNRVDDLATNVAAALGGLDDRARETTALAQRVDEASSTSRSRRAAPRRRATPCPGNRDPEVERRLVEPRDHRRRCFGRAGRRRRKLVGAGGGRRARTAAVEQLPRPPVSDWRSSSATATSPPRRSPGRPPRGQRDRSGYAAARTRSAQASAKVPGNRWPAARRRPRAPRHAGRRPRGAAAEIVRVSAALEAERAACSIGSRRLPRRWLRRRRRRAQGPRAIERGLRELGTRVRASRGGTRPPNRRSHVSRPTWSPNVCRFAPTSRPSPRQSQRPSHRARGPRGSSACSASSALGC